jgi:hypothetical protein
MSAPEMPKDVHVPAPEVPKDAVAAPAPAPVAPPHAAKKANRAPAAGPYLRVNVLLDATWSMNKSRKDGVCTHLFALRRILEGIFDPTASYASDGGGGGGADGGGDDARFANMKPIVNMWKFGGKPGEYKHVIKNATCITDVNKDEVWELVEPAHGTTALHYAVEKFFDYVYAQMQTDSVSYTRNVVVTDGENNVTGYGTLGGAKAAHARVKDLPHSVEMFLACGGEEVFDAAVALGMDKGKVLQVDHSRPQCVDRSARAVSMRMRSAGGSFTQAERQSSMGPSAYVPAVPMAPAVAPFGSPPMARVAPAGRQSSMGPMVPMAAAAVPVGPPPRPVLKRARCRAGDAGPATKRAHL